MNHTQHITTVISILYANSEPIRMNDLAIKAKVTERKLRLIIAEIREKNLIEGYVLCSDDSGYWISNDADEINQWLSRYLSYAFSMIKTSKAAKEFITEQQAKDIQYQLQF
jgi:hypothetical protein